MTQRRRFILNLLLTLPVGAALHAQGTLADYQRAHDLQNRVKDLVVNVPGPAHWIGDSHHFWYARSVKGGTEYMLVDADAAAKTVAFDHQRLSDAVSKATGKQYTPVTLPFQSGLPHAPGRSREGEGQTAPLTFLDDEKALQFGLAGSLYRCDLQAYTCGKTGLIDDVNGEHRRASEDPALQSPKAIDSEGPGGDPHDGLAWQPAAGKDDSELHREAQPCAPRADDMDDRSELRAEHLGMGAQFPGQAPPRPPEVCASFDGKWEAFIQDFNVYLKPVGKGDAVRLSFDGTENNYYSLRSLAWSPDSKKLAAYHTRPGFDREITYIESSPADQIQPKHMTIEYAKPGDPVDVASPVLFDVATRAAKEIDHALFPNPYDLSPPVWWKDGRGFTFEYNQRGHQTYRVIEVDANTAQPRALIDEESPTFFYYSDLGPGLSAGRKFRYDVNDGNEVIWASERDGWEHLYLYDGHTGKLKNQITKGDWLVREVVYVDEAKRKIWFTAGGSIANQDPYFTQYYRINFDGTGLTRLTDADGMHTAVFSKDRKFYVDAWQRVDLAPVAQLRRSEDQKIALELEKGDTSALRAAGFKAPEVFVAKGRDGKTDIWGTITRPLNFDPKKKYPVIENIYAGPQGSFVPKTFSALAPDQALAELGFVVVHIDGMGTSNRSKAFHDVAWKNLADAGLPDRILWHKSAAAKYPYYDISRVGIFGTSAGGQSSMGAMLFHPEFYKVAVTNSGCQDNRMDKMWWNEQWMGYPVGPQYAASSNVDNASRLQGHVLIIAGELDSNVDPASSLQVVNALVKAHKHFDMLYIPGQNHGVGVLSDEHYRDDYFVHHLLGVEPPDWNRVRLTEIKSTTE
ncbi:S9 family peptidase [Granulicella paludicola]|uniref:S9 family peptidase n=1 Tax=Granulicella paludicola TaxID=474951 RepID=UPI0021DF5220|nr:S9 family peptidase [Granulicella paludicola]